jgi:branched-chain amino acid transport system permease protein
MFELVRSIAVDILPGSWQIVLGSVLLLTILFLPEGLGSVFSRLRRGTP